MDFWDALATGVGTVGGGVGGFFLGGPAGALAGAGLGGNLGHTIEQGINPDTSGADEAHRLADLYANLKYTDPKSDPQYAAALKQLRDYSTGALTPEDRAREYEALGETQNFASGQAGAIAQDAAARGGGGAGVNAVSQQVAAQGAAKRLGAADVATAGMASRRALLAQQEFLRQMNINNQLQQQFAEWKTGGQAAGIKNLQDIKEREAAAQNANLQALLNSVSSMGMGMSKGSAPASPMPSPSSIPNPSLAGTGYVPQDGFGGFRSSLPAPVDFNAIDAATPTTADAAARAYAASLPFHDMATPGSAPSTSSHSPIDPEALDPTAPRKVVIPGSY